MVGHRDLNPEPTDYESVSLHCFYWTYERGVTGKCPLMRYKDLEGVGHQNVTIMELT